MFFSPFTQLSKQFDTSVPDGQMSCARQWQDSFHNLWHNVIFIPVKQRQM